MHMPMKGLGNEASLKFGFEKEKKNDIKTKCLYLGT